MPKSKIDPRTALYLPRVLFTNVGSHYSSVRIIHDLGHVFVLDRWKNILNAPFEFPFISFHKIGRGTINYNFQPPLFEGGEWNLRLGQNLFVITLTVSVCQSIISCQYKLLLMVGPLIKSCGLQPQQVRS